MMICEHAAVLRVLYDTLPASTGSSCQLVIEPPAASGVYN